MRTKRPRCREPGDAEVFGLLSAIPVEGEGLEPLDGHTEDREEAEGGRKTTFNHRQRTKKIVV